MRAELRVDVGAIEHNVVRLAAAAPQSAVCAVVKANGYGHGMMISARAALAGGATWLAVATSQEGRELRAVHHDVPIIVLGALTGAELELALAHRLDVTAWTPGFAEHVIAAATAQPGAIPARVHVKLDTGLGRLGTRDAAEADYTAGLIAAASATTLVAGMTHFATADEMDDDGTRFFYEQLERFERWARELRRRHPGVLLHTANSAATLREPRSHFDLVRCGAAVYGLDPFGIDPTRHGLAPSAELVVGIAAVKDCAAGESTGYGRRFVAARPTTVATVPIGYGDGYRRAFSCRGPVLIGGCRSAILGTVSMDNITVDVTGIEPRPEPGDEAVLIGVQGAERVTTEELANAIGTINYEIVTGLTARLPRVPYRAGERL